MRITCKLMHRFVILCFLFTCTAAAADHISINCGGGAAALSGGKWGGDSDAAPKGSSKASTVNGELITAVDPVPYSTARISRSQFSYSFHLTPGQKFIRLHFNPLPYYGFESFLDFFTVEAGPFTLLANFSASVTARALSLNVIAKEFCLIIQENQPLHIVFSPETSFNYAFINGIEIISVPSTISYCHGGDTGVHVLGQKSVIYIDNTTALERVYHQNIKWGSVSFGNDIGGMFGVWASLLQENAHKASNLSYGVSVDVGFRYLVRVHLCELGSKMDFVLMIDNIVALASADMLQQSKTQSVFWYNYMVMVKGNKREGKHRISISLHSQHEFVDRQGPLEGFEVFKLSNHDLSLATPNPLPPSGDSPPHSTPTLLHSLLGRKNAIATVVFAKIFLANIIVHLLYKLLGTADSSEEENEPSARANRPACRRFSLAEIQSATDNFHSGFIIGKGGFGKVYKGFIDNGREIVAVKRLKPDSNQGEQQFWTEVEMLSELRHVNLVPLLGFCVEQQEMMLVYEFMPCGTLADHLFKLAQKTHDYIPLSWKQRLKICIGAGRAIDYLHTGHGIIHRDVKSSNILLDEKFVAKVSDFGLAKTGFGSDSQSQQSTLVKGTRGYLDPNYCETHKPTKDSDTYSFGVVLLEVLCGRRALEQYDEEDKCRLTTWAIDNIRKGQVADIVFPSLIGEISPDSLKSFVRVAKRCLHDQPKKRPAMAHIVMKLELALQQQEKAESLDPNERTGVENLFSSTDKYQNDNMNLMVPNEKINIGLPQMENATSSAPNEIRNVTDVMPRSDNDRTILSTSLKPTAFSSNVKTVSFLPSQQINSTMINSGGQGGRKSMMLRISRKLWPWDAFWKTRKPSKYKTDLVGTSVSAPISRGTSSIPMDDNTERTDGMILAPATVSSNEIEQHSQTMRVMDNVSEGQVDRIVAPTLRGEISPDSLRAFVNIAERWLHDEPKNRPRTIHIVTNIELALQQQEMAESSLPKDRITVEGGDTSFAGTSQKANMKLFGPNEKINVANDASPSLARQVSPSTGTSQKTNLKLFEPNKKIDVADDAGPSLARQVPLYTGTSQKANMGLFGANKKVNVADDASHSLAGQVPSSTSTSQKADNISKGQVDHIVAPTLRAKISSDSLAERWLHDEPKNQPTTMHIVTKNEPAFQQQEMANSLPPKDRTTIESASSTGTTQKAVKNFLLRNDKINVSDDASPSIGGQVLPQPSLRVFAFAELRAATRNFRPDYVLGEGGFGRVYKGWINEKSGIGEIVAVKKLNHEGLQGREEWQSEVNFLGRLSHPNLVKLLGYCYEDKELLLVYEFMSKGSLDHHLFRRVSSIHPLTWDIRLKILIGAARALAFLHASMGTVIFRDFKASNILLDGSYNAKLSDFGLAKSGPSDSFSHVSTRIMGTYGYAAPEYVATGHLYVKSDVYGFGVVLLEILTGLCAHDTRRRPSGQQNLVDWMKPYLSNKRKLKQVIDVRLEGRYPSKSAQQLAKVALTCLEPQPKNRPSMQEIVEILEKIDSERPKE